MILDTQPVRQEFEDRMDTILRILDSTHGNHSAGVERESRGLAILLMFAAYERLLHELTRLLIDAASRLRVGNRRLRPGFRALALHSYAVSLRDSSPTKFYSKTLTTLVAEADRRRDCTLSSDVFPDDGSYMKASQISVWCSLFKLPPAQQVLKNIWPNIDGVVSDRNGIAHGRLLPEQVGRDRSEADVRGLLHAWRSDWIAFVDHIQAVGSSRDFYREP